MQLNFSVIRWNIPEKASDWDMYCDIWKTDPNFWLLTLILPATAAESSRSCENASVNILRLCQR